MRDCLIYKLSYYRFGEVSFGYGAGAGYDQARRYDIGHKNFELTYLEEAFTSEHWIVRIFRVRPAIVLTFITITRHSTASLTGQEAY
jgi:dolichyl-diphosphooligosaccharide--protein glycosyltransferase